MPFAVSVAKRHFAAALAYTGGQWRLAPIALTTGPADKRRIMLRSIDSHAPLAMGIVLCMVVEEPVRQRPVGIAAIPVLSVPHNPPPNQRVFNHSRQFCWYIPGKIASPEQGGKCNLLFFLSLPSLHNPALDHRNLERAVRIA